jgi:DNA-directed RNA polymerase subunit RPC12/RpoP
MAAGEAIMTICIQCGMEFELKAELGSRATRCPACRRQLRTGREIRRLKRLMARSATKTPRRDCGG